MLHGMRCRDVYVFHTDVAECQDESLSGLIVFKLSKEAKSSKYWDWAKSAADSKDVLGTPAVPPSYRMPLRARLRLRDFVQVASPRLRP